MYTVLHKNKSIAGPREWSSKFFEHRIGQYNIKASIPESVPETLPLIINEDIKIVPTTVTYEAINPMIQYHHGPVWTIEENNVTAEFLATDMPIDQAKSNFRNQAANERYKKEVAGTKVTIQGLEVFVNTDRDSRNIFFQKFSLMEDGDTVKWKFPEGWITLTKAELGQIIQAGVSHIQSAFDWEKDINDQIDAAQTIEELPNIVIIEKARKKINIE